MVAMLWAAACNLITGAADLRFGDPSGGPDATSDGAATDGTVPPNEGGPADGGADAFITYACSGEACFDAGTCAGGPCPVRIVATQTGAIDRVAANANGAYWTIPSLKRIDRLLGSSSSPNVLYASDGTPSSITANAQSVFWTEPDKNRVRRISAIAPLDGTPDRTKNDQQGAFLVTVGPLGNFVAWTTSNGSVFISSEDLGATVVAGTDQVGIVGMGITPSSLYWAAAGSINEVRRVTIAGGTSFETLASAPSPRGLATGDTRAAWITKGTITATLDGLPKVTYVGENDPAAIAGAGEYAYWVDRQGGMVRRGTMDGSGNGVAQTLIAGQKQPRAIAVGGGKVYWVNDTGGEVWSLVLPNGPPTP